MCPYGKRVAAMPKCYRDAKTRIFIFAGGDAWPRAKQYLDAGEPCLARERYVLVCPERMEDHVSKESRLFNPRQANWPVAGLDVLIIDCAAPERLLEQLAASLRRDRASSAAMMRCPAIHDMDAIDMRVWGSFERYFDWEISTKQRWSIATWFDPSAAESQAYFDWQRRVAHLAYELRHGDSSGRVRAICETLPEGSLGRSALQEATG